MRDFDILSGSFLFERSRVALFTLPFIGGDYMKKLTMAILLMVVGSMLVACGEPAPNAELDYHGGEENVIIENIITE